MKRIAALAVILVCCSSPVGAGAAEEQGVLVGGALTNGQDSDFGVGVRAEYPLDTVYPGLSVAGGLNYFFPDDYWGHKVTFWEINVNALYSFPDIDIFMLYAGGGLNYYRTKSDSGWPRYSDSGPSLNIVGGCKLNLGLVMVPFAEIRVGIGDNDQFAIAAGALYSF